MTFAIDGPIGAGDRVVPHEVDRDRIDWVGYCGECGEQITTDDGMYFWHHNETLNPSDDPEPSDA